MSNTRCLEVHDLHKSYSTRSQPLQVLRGITLELDYGASVVIMGPSGSGKSTLLHILGTLEPPTSGSVRIGGRDPFRLPERALAAFRNQFIGFIFQEHHLLPQCSVMENVLLPTLPRDGSPGDAEARAGKLLERVGLTERRDHRPAELSGGERQRAAIARALINQPQLLLCDEPTGNLDRSNAESVGSLFLELCAEEQVAVVLVTHSQGLAQRFHTRMDLADGQLRGGGA